MQKLIHQPGCLWLQHTLLMCSGYCNHVENLRTEIHMNTEDETFWTTHYQQVWQKYVENEYCAKYIRFSFIQCERILNNNLISSILHFHSHQTSLDPSDLSSDDEECSTSKRCLKRFPDEAVAQPVYWLCLNWHPESPMNWGPVNPILMMTTMIPWPWAFNLWYGISLTGGIKRRKHI